MNKLITSLARVAVCGGAILLAVTIFVMPRISRMQVHADLMCGNYCGYQNGTTCVFIGTCTDNCACGLCNEVNPYNHNLSCGGVL
jgi:hypothetical protein